MSNIRYKTQDTKILDIMHDVRQGKYIIPVYQREYVWGSKQIIDLIDSIMEGYPIGMITDAAVKNESLLANGKNEIFDVLNQSPGRIEKAIVDGQQRVTSLSLVYFADVIADNFKKFKNDKLKKEVKKVINNLYFYENRAYEKDKLILHISEQHPEKKGVEDIVDQYVISKPEVTSEFRAAVDEYVIPVLKILDGSDKEVIDVFTAMNKGGIKLTHVELMNGSMFNIENNFGLLDYIKLNNSKFKTFGSIKGEFFVQLMKTYFDIIDFKSRVDYKKDTLIKFSMDKRDVMKFFSIREEFTEMLEESIGMLSSEFGIFRIEQLPKNVYLTAIIAYRSLLKINNTDPDKSKLKRIMKRISTRLIDGVYASSPGARALEDINDFIMPVMMDSKISDDAQVFEEIWDAEKIGNTLNEKVSELTYKNRHQGLAKLFISILCRNHPRYILENKKVSVIESVGLKVKNDLHHFIPKKSSMVKEYVLDNKYQDWNIETIRNIAVITEDENRKEIRAKDIQEYLEESKRNLNDDNFRKMIESHYFDLNIINELMAWRKEEDELGLELKRILVELFDARGEIIISEIMDVFFNEKIN